MILFLVNFNTKKINLLILSFIIAVIPLIVYMHRIQVNERVRNYLGHSINSDFFSFYKMIWLLVMTFILLIAFLIYAYKNNLKKTYYYIPVIIYIGLVVASAYYADFSSIVNLGFINRYENVYVLLTYLFLMIVTINLVDDKYSAKFILSSLFISAFILGIHGLTQFLGVDPLQTDLGRKFILPSDYRPLSFMIDFRYSVRRISSTMFNPNYVGSYAAMLISLILGFYINAENKKKKVLMGILSALMFSFLVGSHSRAGFVGFIIGLFILTLLLRKQIAANWRSVMIIIFVFLMIFVSMDVYSVENIFKEMTFPATEPEILEEEMKLPPLTDVRTSEENLTFVTSTIELNLILKDNMLNFYDTENNQLTYEIDEEDGIISFAEDGYDNHSFRMIPDQGLIRWDYDNKSAIFRVIDGQFTLRGMNNNFYEIKDVNSWGFEGYEKLGSSRGYIWSRSIPLLKDTIILGYGPDTYAMYYPQEDVKGKLMFLSSPEMIVDKPHNMYLQIAINTGVISLLALLVLWGGYIIEGIKLYWNADYDRWENKVGISILSAVVAYLVTGIFNDSVVSVAPVFWILLGIGISMNHKIKNNYRQ